MRIYRSYSLCFSPSQFLVILLGVNLKAAARAICRAFGCCKLTGLEVKIWYLGVLKLRDQSEQRKGASLFKIPAGIGAGPHD
jgi:hypothetical protein